MNQIVEIYKDEPRAGTFLISEGFKRRHVKVIELINKHYDRFLDAESFAHRGAKLLTRKVKTKGRPVIEFLLNEEQTFFLGMLFRATSDQDDPVLNFKAKLARDFIKQKKLLDSLLSQRQSSKWVENRARGKAIRKEETDTIKDFVIYAKSQGSKNADKYYTVLSTCVNSTMFNFSGKFKNRRDNMTTSQLVDVKFADRIVSRGLIDGMHKSLPYKEIYKLVKSRLINLADMYGKSDVISRKIIEIEN